MASAKKVSFHGSFVLFYYFLVRVLVDKDITQINGLYRYGFNEILDIMTYSCDSSSSSSSSEDEDLDFLLLDSL